MIVVFTVVVFAGVFTIGFTEVGFGFTKVGFGFTESQEKVWINTKAYKISIQLGLFLVRFRKIHTLHNYALLCIIKNKEKNYIFKRNHFTFWRVRKG